MMFCHKPTKRLFYSLFRSRLSVQAEHQNHFEKSISCRIFQAQKGYDVLPQTYEEAEKYQLCCQLMSVDVRKRPYFTGLVLVYEVHLTAQKRLETLIFIFLT